MSNTPTQPSADWQAWGLLVLLSLVWGSSFILIKKALMVYGPGEVGALRILSAALVLLPWALYRVRHLSFSELGLLAALGLFGSFLPAFLFALAQTRLDSAVTGMLNAVTPFFVLLIGVFSFRQKILSRQMIGLLIGFSGTCALLLAGSGGDLSRINYFAFLIVLASICYGINLNLIKYRLAKVKALTITAVSLMVAGPVAAIYLWGFTDFNHTLLHQEGSWLALSLVMVLGVIGTAMALVIFNYLVKITTPVFASSVTYLIPIVAVLWGLWDGEQLLGGHYLAMGLILSGLYVTNRRLA